MILEQSQAGRFTYLGISKMGHTHVKRYKKNQDAIAFFALDDSFVIAVSDGLGSCERSHIGSHRAVLICTNMLVEIADGHLEFEGASIAKRLTDLWTEAFARTVSRKYSATVKAVFSQGDELVGVSLGDGLLFVVSGEQTLQAPIPEGDFINETVCLSHGLKPTALWTGRITMRGDTVVFLTTDGVSSTVSEGRELELVREIAAIKDTSELRLGIVDMLGEIEKYNSDDMTVGVVKV